VWRERQRSPNRSAAHPPKRSQGGEPGERELARGEGLDERRRGVLPEEVVGNMVGIAASTDVPIAHIKFSRQKPQKYSPFLRLTPVDADAERHGGAKRRRARRGGMDSPQAKEAGRWSQ